MQKCAPFVPLLCFRQNPRNQESATVFLLIPATHSGERRRRLRKKRRGNIPVIFGQRGNVWVRSEAFQLFRCRREFLPCRLKRYAESGSTRWGALINISRVGEKKNSDERFRVLWAAGRRSPFCRSYPASRQETMAMERKNGREAERSRERERFHLNRNDRRFPRF